MRVVSLLIALVTCLSAFAEAPPIQQWINDAIKAGGGVVTIPEGEHVLPAGLILKDAKKLALRGVDKQRCILKLAPGKDSGAALVEITGSSETIEIANLTLEGDSAAHTTQKTLIKVSGSAATQVKDVTVRDCLFQDFPATGVLLEGATGCLIERCSFRDGGVAAVNFSHSSSECVARGNQIIRCSTAFELLNSSHCVLEGNEARNGTDGIHIRGGKFADLKAGHIIRNNGLFGMKGQALKIAGGMGSHKIESNDTP